MIVKGIIKTINFLENSCTVRLPLFETAAASGEVVLDAIISIQPGLYNGYTEGDVVFVDFENNKLSQPVVVGKLYLGTEKEAAAATPSAMTVSNLKVTTQATLPVDTRLSLEGLGSSVPVEKGITSYHSLVDIIKALHQTETSVQQTIKDQSGTISNIIVEYLSLPVNAATPTPESVGWSTSTPLYQDGFSIWQKTTCYNHRGQTLSTEITCLSSIASAVLYKVRCSTLVHAGVNQTEPIRISAWVKLGTEVETLDTTANICYCWSAGDGSSHTNWTVSESYEVTLSPEQLRAQNLVIQVKHGEEIYEEATIMYAPLNSPVLHLSNETDTLLYAANGTDCLTAGGVCSTATLYVNGDPLEATYVWEWDSQHCTCEYAVDEGGQQLLNTIIVTAINSTTTPGVVTCTATVTLDGPFKGKTYSKDFTVTQTKVGTSIVSQDTYYALIHNKHSAGNIKTPPTTGDLIVRDKDGNQLNTKNESFFEKWSLTPPEHTPDTNGWKYWTTVKTTYSTSLADFEFSTPIISEDLNGVYALARGKTTTYYGEKEPTADAQKVASNSSKYVYTPGLRENDSWFNTAPTSGVGGELRQWNGEEWLDISDEIVANKVTTTYVDALDITAKKIEVLDKDETTLFEADGLSDTHTVKIAGFKVSSKGLFTDGFGTSYSEAGKKTSGVYVGEDGIKLGKNFSVSNSGAVIASSLQIKDTTNTNVDINTALSNTEKAAIDESRRELQEAFTINGGPTTLGDNWLATTSVYAKNLSAGKIEVKDNTAAKNIVFYANAEEPDKVQIGKFVVDSNSISFPVTENSTQYKFGKDGTVLLCTGTSGKADIGGSGEVDGWNFTAGTNFGIRTIKSGADAGKSEMYVSKGKIGGFTINGTKISKGTLGSSSSVHISTANMSGTLGDATDTTKQQSATNWRLTVGSGFGVKSSGVLYSKDGVFDGALTPSTAKTGSLGTKDKRWGEIYSSNLNVDGTITSSGKIKSSGVIEATGQIQSSGGIRIQSKATGETTAKDRILVNSAGEFCVLGGLWAYPKDTDLSTDAGRASMTFTIQPNGAVAGERIYFKVADYPAQEYTGYYQPVIRLRTENSPNCFWSKAFAIGGSGGSGWKSVSLPDELKDSAGSAGNNSKIIAILATGKFPKDVDKKDPNSSDAQGATFYTWWNGTHAYVYNPISKAPSDFVINIVILGKM